VRRESDPGSIAENHTIIETHLRRVEVRANQLVIELKPACEYPYSDGVSDRKLIHVPWQKPPSKRRREIIAPESKTLNDTRPIRADARARLIVAISKGRKWLDEIVTGDVVDFAAIAARERCSVRCVNMTISLAFLAPELVKAAIKGRLPRGIGIGRLCDPPAEWPQQYKKLGLTSPK